MTQASLPSITEPLYDRMRRLGVDMGWYDRAIAKKPAGQLSDNRPIPLCDEFCGVLSIYLLKRDGSLWTVESDGAPFTEVRTASKQLPREVYICMHCEAQFRGIGKAKEHYMGQKQ